MTIPTDKAKLASELLDMAGRHEKSSYGTFATTIDLMRRAAEALSPQGAVAGETTRTTPEMRARIRELALSPSHSSDDYDRAVLMLCEDFDALSTAPKLKHQTGWLIEAGWSEGSMPDYWCGSYDPWAADLKNGHTDNFSCPQWPYALWTNDHQKAVRFARKEDAERVAASLYQDVKPLVCEHSWDMEIVREPPTKPNDAGLSDKTDREIATEIWHSGHALALDFATPNPATTVEAAWDTIETSVIDAMVAAMARAGSAGDGFVVTEETVEAACKAFYAAIEKKYEEEGGEGVSISTATGMRAALAAAANVGEGRG